MSASKDVPAPAAVAVAAPIVAADDKDSKSASASVHRDHPASAESPSPLWPILEWKPVDGLDFLSLLRHVRVRDPHRAKMTHMSNANTIEVSLGEAKGPAHGGIFQLKPDEPLVCGRSYQFRVAPDHDFALFSGEEKTLIAGKIVGVDKGLCLYGFTPDASTPTQIYGACTCHDHRTGTMTVLSPQLPTIPPGMSFESLTHLLTQRTPAQKAYDAMHRRMRHFNQIAQYADTTSAIGQLISVGADLLRLYLQLSEHEEVERKVQKRLQKLMVLIMVDQDEEGDDDVDENGEDKANMNPPLPEDEEPVIVMGGIKPTTPPPTKEKDLASPIAIQIWEVFEQFLYLPDTPDRAQKLELLNHYRQLFYGMWKAEHRTIHKFLLVALPAIKFIMMEVRERQQKKLKQQRLAATAAK